MNVKWYTLRKGLLDLHPDASPDLYLVLTGPRSPATHSRGAVEPWEIDGVYLFDGPRLVADLRRRGIKIGIATSIRAAAWKAARIYPPRLDSPLKLSTRQVQLLRAFGPRTSPRVPLLRIAGLMAGVSGEGCRFPATEVFNEGWMLRLTLDWMERSRAAGLPLSLEPGFTWFSEARLPSAFLPRRRGDPQGEGWTHADAVLGHVEIGREGKAGVSLRPGAEVLVVVEAKMFSPLSKGIAHAPDYDQAARTVACMAELCARAGREPGEMKRLAFIVIAPESQIEAGVFREVIDRKSIARKVQNRVDGFGVEKKEWFRDWFIPTLEKIEIYGIAWEAMVSKIEDREETFGREFGAFYGECVRLGSRGRS